VVFDLFPFNLLLFVKNRSKFNPRFVDEISLNEFICYLELTTLVILGPSRCQLEI
jgi:hypothetical protein